MVDEILGAPPAATSAEEMARSPPVADAGGRPYQRRGVPETDRRRAQFGAGWPALSAAEGGGPVVAVHPPSFQRGCSRDVRLLLLPPTDRPH